MAVPPFLRLQTKELRMWVIYGNAVSDEE